MMLVWSALIGHSMFSNQSDPSKQGKLCHRYASVIRCVKSHCNYIDSYNGVTQKTYFAISSRAVNPIFSGWICCGLSFFPASYLPESLLCLRPSAKDLFNYLSCWGCLDSRVVFTLDYNELRYAAPWAVRSILGDDHSFSAQA